MTDTFSLSDKELDALLKASPHPITDDGFTERLLQKIERQERVQRYLPIIFGAVGAIISSFFLSANIFKNTITPPLMHLADITPGHITPAIIALLVCIPLIIPHLLSNNS